VQSPVSGEHYSILGTIASPENQMGSMLLLAHTLGKEGAKRLTGVLPYLAYMREDHPKPDESLATAWVGTILEASGFDEIWTVDLHSEHDKHFFPLALESLAGRVIRKMHKKPWTRRCKSRRCQQGCYSRCEAVKSAAGMTSSDIIYFNKRLTVSGIVHSDLIGKVGSRAVIVDDMLDTGRTLISACQRLMHAGAEELYVFVTHGLFTGQSWRDLWPLRAKHIFCTDTIPACTTIDDPRITYCR
jgi:ribose-phosphate pyrophosphokinase